MNRIDLRYIETKELNCKGCTNCCTVLRFHFPNGNTSFAGNKCEKIFFSKKSAKKKAYNAFEVKNKILFSSHTPFLEEVRGSIGIPRVLNMFENFPFWKTFFEACGFAVFLSPESNTKLYQSGVGSVMSDNICFPAKLVHGHILSLIEAKVDRIFYPIVPKEEKESAGSNNSYNCPVVSGYPDVIRSAIDPQANFGIPFDTPVINFANEKALKEQCWEYLSSIVTNQSNESLEQVQNHTFAKITRKTFKLAFDKANTVRKTWNTEFIANQQDILQKCIASGELCFVVAGRPYHADLLVNQKAGQILSDLGVNVVTDDVFRLPEGAGFRKLNFVSQWSYPNRVVQAAIEIAKLPQNVQLVQLNSFGCGPDSFFMDEIGEILRQAGKKYTLFRNYENSSPGSIRLRCRSLIESLKTTIG